MTNRPQEYQPIEGRQTKPNHFKKSLLFALVGMLLGGGVMYFIQSSSVAKTAETTATTTATATATTEKQKQTQSTDMDPNISANKTTTGELLLKKSELITPSLADAKESIRATGTLRARDTLIVKAKGNGTLQGFDWQVGQNIQKGQTVASVDNTDYQNRYQQAQQQLNASLEQQELLQKQYNRQKQLVVDGFISENALDTLATNLSVAKSQYESSRNALEIAKKSQRDQSISSPISGVIANKFAQNGENIMPDMRLLEVINPQSIELEVAISDQDIAKIKTGQNVNISYAGTDLSGRVIRIAPSTQANSRLVNVYIHINAAGTDLKVGTFASAEILLDGGASLQNQSLTYQIPTNLLQAKVVQNPNTKTEETSYYIYTFENNKIMMKDVKLLSKNSSTAIIQGMDISQNTQLINMPLSIDQTGKAVKLIEG